MTPKEKAEELAVKMCSSMDVFKPNPKSKRSALIAVDEILSLGTLVGNNLSDSFYIYWQEVKKEIELL